MAAVGDELRRERLITAALLALALGLRFASYWASQSGPYSYDLVSHLQYLEWFRQHDTLPDCHVSRVATHPPLFHFLAGLMRRHGAALLDVRLLSLVAAWLRCGVVFVALHRLVADRAARWFAMALYAVLPASVHLDGMVSNESLSCLFCAIAIWLAVEALRSEARWALWIGCGVAMGAAFWCKASVLTLVVALPLAVVATRRWRQLRGVSVATLAFVAVSGWLVAHNLATYGKLVPLTFDCRELGDAAPFLATPYWQRRPLGFFLGFDPAIFALPYFPTGLEPPRFWSVLLASTFADYYNYGFGHRNTVFETGLIANTVGINLASVWLSRLSVAGGALISLGVLAGLVALGRDAIRQARSDLAFVVAAPLVAVLGALHFAVRYPIDYLGMIKGAYLVYVAPLPCVGAGLAFAWLLRRSRVGAVVLVAALLLVAGYTIYCRVPLYAYPE